MTALLPSGALQLTFLANVQRILEEGQFAATYKFALLIALVDLAVERGDDTGASLTLPLGAIAEKFVEMYWGHTVPFNGGVLQQNTGANIAMLGHLEAIQRIAPRMDQARHKPEWSTLIRNVAGLVRTMPLLKLQTLRGDSKLTFLYDERLENGAITLVPGAGFCLRRFSGLIRGLVRNAWLAEVRCFAKNRQYINESQNLADFLFGSERIALEQVRDVLLPLQENRCFYCNEYMAHGSHVDHFVPFALYPAHFAHNFVLAHASCNGDKSSLLADLPHLERWMARNVRYGAEITDSLEGSQAMPDLDSTTNIARWAYRRAADSGALLWMRRGETRRFPTGARMPL